MLESFDSVFFPMAAEDVLGNLIQQDAFYLPGDPAKFHSLFSESDFWKCVHDATNVRAVFPKLKQATVRGSEAKDLYDAGATICLSGLERSYDPFRRLAEDLGSALDLRGLVEVKAYNSPDGMGFDSHYDPRNVTAVQVSGTKKWWYGTSVYEHYPLGNSPYPLPEKDLPLSIEVDLTPGDILFLPAGTIHRAAAKGSSLSLNISFEYLGSSVAEMFCRSLRDALLVDPGMRVPLFTPSTSGSLTRDANDKLLERLEDTVRPLLAQVLAQLTGGGT